MTPAELHRICEWYGLRGDMCVVLWYRLDRQMQPEPLTINIARVSRTGQWIDSDRFFPPIRFRAEQIVSVIPFHSIDDAHAWLVQWPRGDHSGAPRNGPNT